MLPNLRQRLFIALAVVIGALVLLGAKSPLTDAGGAGGLSLMSARIGAAPACALAVVACLPAVMLGALVSSAGHPLGGVFAAAAAIGILGAAGGSGGQWVLSHESHLPGAYLGLIVETFIWHLPVGVLVISVALGRTSLREQWPALSAHDDKRSADAWPRLYPNAVYAAVVSSVVAGIVGLFLIRAADTSQVIVCLILAFVVGGLLGKLFFPDASPLLMLFGPALVAVGAYTYALYQFDDGAQMLAGWWNNALPTSKKLPGLCLALPVHYVSAGLLGTTLGIGWAEVMLRGNTEVTESNEPEDVADPTGPARNTS